MLSTGGVASRNGSPLPESISAKVYHVMADQVVMGPQREAGLSYVDSLFWGKARPPVVQTRPVVQTLCA